VLVPGPASDPAVAPLPPSGAFDVGTGTSGTLSLMSFTTAPQLPVAPAPAPVPAPVIAAPEGSPAGVLPPAEVARSPLEDLLAEPPEDTGRNVTTQLAAPDLATDTANDPLVDLAPAAFVLSASLGGLLVAGRRRAR
jgi:hypothetical protein